MKSRALYYPYIEVPQSAWFTRVLLYWDEVGAIVPYDYIEDPDRLGEYMVGLVREHLVKQVVPGMYLWKVPRFADSFLEYLGRRAGQSHPTADMPWTRVHMEKLQELGEKLCLLGLAKKERHEEYSPWYEVEPTVADDFMAYLAAVLGQLGSDGDAFTPLTDHERHLNHFVAATPSVTRRDPIRKMLLEQVLPGPSDAVVPAQLADFKNAHEKALREFRLEIESKIAQWAPIENDADRDIAVSEGVRQMQERIAELESLMKKSKWPRVGFAGLCAAAVAGLEAWQSVDLKLALPGAALNLAPAVFDAFRGIQIDPTRNPLAYAVLAQKSLAQ